MSNRAKHVHRITVGELSDTIRKELDMFNSEIIAAINEASKRAADMGVKELKAISPVSSRTYNKKYRSGWVHTVTSKDPLGVVIRTIHNKTKPGLTHLLEFPHRIAYRRRGQKEITYTGEFTSGIPHIIPTGDKVAEQFYDELTRL